MLERKEPRRAPAASASPRAQRRSEPAAAPLDGARAQRSLDAAAARFGDLLGRVPARRPESSGAPLPDELRGDLERSFDADFSTVRVHQDQRAPSLGAIASAEGEDLHFAPGRYDPSSRSGRALLGHELAHTVQQRRGQVRGAAGAIHHDARLEAQADDCGARAALGEPAAPAELASAAAPTAAPPIQRKVVYPLQGRLGPITKSTELLHALLAEFTLPNAPVIIADLLPSLESSTVNYTSWEKLLNDVSARVHYDAGGSVKWREFIDQQHWPLAAAAANKGDIPSPAHGYDVRYDNNDTRNDPDRLGPAHASFQEADEYTAQRLNNPLDADEYLHMHLLSAQHMSPAKKGWREDQVTWGLEGAPTEEQAQALGQKGLGVKKIGDGAGAQHQAVVPAPVAPMAAQVQALFTQYYETIAGTEDLNKGFMAIIDLYQALEALHPFKDATSRTNHLVLNKLLAENGMSPAILNAPDSPVRSREEWAKIVLAASTEGRKWASKQAPNADLQTARSDRRGARYMDARLEAIGQDAHLPPVQDAPSAPRFPAAPSGPPIVRAQPQPRSSRAASTASKPPASNANPGVGGAKGGATPAWFRGTGVGGYKKPASTPDKGLVLPSMGSLGGPSTEQPAAAAAAALQSPPPRVGASLSSVAHDTPPLHAPPPPVARLSSSHDDAPLPPLNMVVAAQPAASHGAAPRHDPPPHAPPPPQPMLPHAPPPPAGPRPKPNFMVSSSLEPLSGYDAILAQRFFGDDPSRNFRKKK